MQFLRVLKISLSAVSSHVPCFVSLNTGLARMTEGIGLIRNISHLYLSYTHFKSGLNFCGFPQPVWISNMMILGNIP